MIKVTVQDIQRAQADLDEAEERLNTLVNRWLNLEPSQRGGALLKAVQGRVELAATRLDHLRQEYDAQQAALAARPGIEKKHAKYVDQAAAEFAASDERVADAVNALQDALYGVVQVVNERNALLHQTGGELSAMGLTFDEDMDYQTCAHIRAFTPRVRLKGRWWVEAEPEQVLNWVNARVAAVWNGDEPELSWHVMEGRSDALLNAVEVPRVPAF